jgi:hypothetical protein
MKAKEQLIAGIGEIRGLAVLYPSDLSIALYRSIDRKLDINAIADGLTERGWFVGRSREPQAIHLALNAVHCGAISDYLADLRDTVSHVKATRRVGSYDDSTY